MSFAHLVYIPGLLLIGIAIGARIGARRVELLWEAERRRARAAAEDRPQG